MRLEPGTPGSPEESLATRLFPPGEGKSMDPYSGIHLVHVHRDVNGTVLRNHDTVMAELRVLFIDHCLVRFRGFSCRQPLVDRSPFFLASPLSL
jgi:hypothetical protein